MSDEQEDMARVAANREPTGGFQTAGVAREPRPAKVWECTESWLCWYVFVVRIGFSAPR